MTQTVQKIVFISISFMVIFVISTASTRMAVAQNTNPMSSTIAVAQVSDESNHKQAGFLENPLEMIVAQAPTKNPLGIKINPETGVPDGAILLTVFLKHDQSKTLDQILEELKQSGYWKAFPPEGVDVISWYVVMGIGQVVTLAVLPERLRAVNVALKRTAWSAYRTEFYATYDFAQVAKRLRESVLKGS